MKHPWKRNPSSLPNNYPQVRKKLERIERRLMKHLEYAASYDKQIKEMEEMQFARKLTPKEIEEWRCPVQHDAHHAVLRPEKKSTPMRILFNSLAWYAGHTFDDYWYKGRDLLNNQFGVVIQFRENRLAICGKIAKMYHMIAIPEDDQHVHRFLWKKFEVDNRPDTYVKTVLTFGDRPALTMAIITMRKTAKMKEEQPKAAEAILKNVYVDYICESDKKKKSSKWMVSMLRSGYPARKRMPQKN